MELKITDERAAQIRDQALRGAPFSETMVYVLDDRATLLAALKAMTAELDALRALHDTAVSNRNYYADERKRANMERDAAREVLKNFEIQGPDGDGLHWLIFHGRNITGKAAVNLGKGGVVSQVARALEEDRRSAIDATLRAGSVAPVVTARMISVALMASDAIQYDVEAMRAALTAAFKEWMADQDVKKAIRDEHADVKDKPVGRESDNANRLKKIIAAIKLSGAVFPADFEWLCEKAEAGIPSSQSIRNEALHEAANTISPKGPRPCDCVTCDCQNYDDAAAVAAWDSGRASEEIIRALTVPEDAASIDTPETVDSLLLDGNTPRTWMKPGQYSQSEMESACIKFNMANAIGTEIKVWSGPIEGEPDPVTVRRPGACILGGHTAVVYVTGGHGCIVLSHVAKERANG